MEKMAEAEFDKVTGTLVFPEGTRIVEGGFVSENDKPNVKRIILPEGVEVIRDRAFWNVGLTEITIPSSVREIGKWAFAYCRNLQTINILCDKDAFHLKSFLECNAMQYRM